VTGSRILFSCIVIVVAAASTCGYATIAKAAAAVPSPTVTANEACDALAGKTFGGGRILNVEFVPAAADVPEYCVVTGQIAGSDINFIANLPSLWNGKARMGATGGWQGSLRRITPSSVASDNRSPLFKGYVDYMTDSGHTGKGDGTFDTSWSTKPEALANFAGLSYERVTDAVKALIRQRYGQDVRHTYFQGCSGGGHIALVMAQRYPRLFDGIIAGAPAPNFIGTFLGWQRGAKALTVPGAHISQAKLAMLGKAVLEKCDKLDGVEDGIVSNPLACTFDPEPLRCKGVDSDSCLTDAQMNLVKEVTTDTVFKDGSLLVKGLRLAGHEDDPANWLHWTAPMTNLPGMPSYFQMATASVVQVLTRDPNADGLSYSVMDDEINIKNLSSLIDAWPGDIAEFGAAGGKLIIWNGTADTPVPFENQILYYDAVVASLGGAAKAEKTVRAFFPPGVNHCGGGAGADRFDYLDALDAWVTRNEPPDGKTIKKVVGGAEVMSRPLCAYPTWPRYKGSGSVNSASSFVCKGGSR
jgi:pimeloyl-ACP methyl ester carboxylesterase